PRSAATEWCGGEVMQAYGPEANAGSWTTHSRILRCLNGGSIAHPDCLCAQRAQCRVEVLPHESQEPLGRLGVRLDPRLRRPGGAFRRRWEEPQGEGLSDLERA